MAKKLNLNESKEKLFRIMEAINPEFGLAQEDAGDDTAKSILGKKVGDVFRGYDGANEIAEVLMGTNVQGRKRLFVKRNS